MFVACDVDGVIAALHDEWYRRYNLDWNDNLDIGRVLNWNTHEFVKPECGKKVYDYLKQPDLYDRIQPMPGAVDGIRRIRELGHEISFVTSNTYGMTDQKARWLERHGFVEPNRGEQLPAELIVTFTKRWINADVLIDDAAHTIKDWMNKPSYSRSILVEYPHNRSLEKELVSLQWQRVHRASAYPAPEQAWVDIVRYFERAA